MQKSQNILGSLIFFCLWLFVVDLTLGFQVKVDNADKESANQLEKESAPVEQGLVTLRQKDGQVTVLVGGELFTNFDHKTYDKPIFYPIRAPGQISMTRNWPMDKDSVGESRDHPHHKSMWISHEINDIDFWTEKEGVVRTDLIETSFVGTPANVFRASSSWVKKSDGKTLLADQSTYWFGGDKKSRWIDCLIRFQASHGDVRFVDTKEGLFAIRTHPDLRLSANKKRGVAKVFGNAINSEGVRGKDVWGQRAKWMLYYGPVDGKPVSIAMYDHPANLRHPTTWHAREYGLVTANPFGLHHFLGKKKGDGEYEVKEGESLELRYRVEFFSGIVTPEVVDATFQEFAKQELSQLELKKP